MAKKPKIVKHSKLGNVTKEVRQGVKPENNEIKNFVWHIGWIDTQHKWWGWKRIEFGIWWNEILPKLRNFESMTWADIQKASGGRGSDNGNGNNSHLVSVEKLSKIAGVRLQEMELDDISDLFSLRLEGIGRMYGIRDGYILKIIWYDHYHNDPKRAVYPVHKKHS